jgi:hypothetical protein
MTAVPDRKTFETAYAGQAPWDIGKPQKPIIDVADQGSDGSAPGLQPAAELLPVVYAELRRLSLSSLPKLPVSLHATLGPALGKRGRWRTRRRSSQDGRHGLIQALRDRC